MCAFKKFGPNDLCHLPRIAVPTQRSRNRTFLKAHMRWSSSVQGEEVWLRNAANGKEEKLMAFQGKQRN